MKNREGCGLLMLYLLAEVAAGPVQTQQQCTTTCTENTKFNYQPGRRYTYKYETQIESFVGEESEQKSTVNMQATAHIDVITKCNLMLKLDNVLLNSGGDDNPHQMQHFKRQLEARALMFAFQDGHIQHTCHDNEEPVWVMNIKRGILSTFQNSMESLDAHQTLIEADVTGKCSTRYKVTGEGITKEKDLSSCTDRNHYYGPLHSSSEPNSLLKSTHKCIQAIEEGIMRKVTCSESHAFQPFSQEQSHVTSSIHQTLTYLQLSEVPSIREGSPTTKSSLLFQHVLEHFGETSARNEAETTLQKLCMETNNGIGLSVPGLFATLVHQLKHIHESETRNIFERLNGICPQSPKIRKIYLDALQMTQSPASVNLIADLLQKSEISQTEAKMWFSSFAFISNPTKQMIVNIMKLQEIIEFDQTALLGISSLIHTYCKKHTDCHVDPDVQKLVNNYIRIIGNDCRVQNDDDYIRKMVALKAIGNTGATVNIIPKLEKCFSSDQTPIEIRTTAIDALRKLPCEQTTNTLWKIYSDFQVASEVRIAAFKMLMKCPTPELINDVEEVLKKEEVNQVGSYVWTYLTNAQESVDPCKQEIRRILYSEILKKKFSTDVRKFSRAFEKSIHSDTLNAGVHADGDIIFPTNSFLPRSAYLNLTVDVMGTSLNLLEIGGYGEGFEPLVESLLGPKKKELVKEPEASLYLRMFGNDVQYLSTKEKRTTDKNFHSLLNQLMNKQEIEITKHTMFLDSGLLIPTCSGFPLRLAANGTAAINLQVRGHLDLQRLHEQNANITVYFKPSAAVQVVGTMEVDMFVKKSGARLVASLQTSMPVSGKIELKQGQLFSVRLDVPEENVNVFDVNSKIFLLNGNQEELLEIDATQKVETQLCTGESPAYILGTEACAIVKYSRPSSQDVFPFPFNGHTQAAFIIRKTDPTLTHYLFQYKANNGQQHNDVFTRYLTLNTPGSTVNREFTGDIAINFDNHSIKTKLITPFKTIAFEGKYHMEEELKHLDGSLTMDGKPIIALNASSITTQYQDTTRHEHELEIDVSGHPIIALKGHTTTQGGHKYAMDYALHHVTKQPITFSGNAAHTITRNNEKYEVDVTLKALQHTLRTKGSVKKTNSNLTSMLSLSHLTPNQNPTTYELVMKHQDMENRKRSLSATLKGTHFAPVSLILSYYQQMTTIKTQLDLSRGEGYQKKTLSLQGTLSYEMSDSNHNVTAVFDAECAKCGISYHVGMNHQYNRTVMNTELSYQYMANNPLMTRWLASRMPRYNQYVYLSSAFVFMPHELDWSGIYQWDANQRYKGHVKYQAHPDTGYGLELNFDPPNSLPIDFVGHYQAGPQSQLSSELNYKGNKYAVTVSREHQENGFKVIADADLLNRHYSSDLLIDTQGKKAQLSFNFERFFSGALKYEANHQECYFKADVRDHYEKWNFTTKYERKENNFNVQIALNLPENIQISYATTSNGKFHSRDYNLQSLAILKLPRDTHQLSFTLTNVGVIFSTNFTHASEFKYMSGDFVVFGSKLNITHQDNRRTQEHYHYITLSSNYDTIRNDINLKLIHEPETGWKAGLLFNMFSESNPQREYKIDAKLYFKEILKKFKFEMVLSHPNTRPYHATLTHDVQNNVIRSTLRYGKVHDATAVMSFTGSYAKTGSKIDINGEGRVAVEYPSDQEFESREHHAKLTATLEKVEAGWQIDGTLDVNGQISSIHGSVQKKPKSANVLLNLHTPYESVEKLALTAAYAVDETNVESHFELTWNERETAAVKLSLTMDRKHETYRDHSLYLAGSLQAIFTKANVDSLLSFSHHYTIFSLKENVKLQLTKDKTIEAKFDYTIAKPAQSIVFDFNILTPFSKWQQSGLKYFYKPAIKNEDPVTVFNMELSHNFQTTDLEVSSSSEPSRSDQHVLTVVTLRTPFNWLQELSFRLMGFDIYNNEMDIHLKIGNNDYSMHQQVFLHTFSMLRYNFHVKVPWRDLKDFSINIQHDMHDSIFEHNSTIAWNLDQSYSLFFEAESAASNSYKAKIQLQTPTNIYGPFEGLLTHRKEASKHSVTASLKYNTDDYITVTYTQGYGSQRQSFNLEITSTIPTMENLILSVENSLNEELDITIATQWDEEHKVMANIKGYATLAQSDLKIEVNTPFNGFRSILIRANHNVESQLYHLNVGMEDDRVAFKFMHTLNDENRRGYIEVKTPNLKSGFSFHSTILPSKYEIDWRLHHNDLDVIKGQMFFIKLTGLLSMKADIKTIFNGYETVSTMLKFGLPDIDPEVLYLKIQFGERDFELKMNSHFGKLLNGYSDIEINSEWYRVVAGIQLKSQFDMASLTHLQGKFYYNDQAIEGNVHYLYNNELVVDVTTPFEDYRHVKLRGYVNKKEGSPSGNFTLHINDVWVRVAVANRMQDGAADLEFKVESSQTRPIVLLRFLYDVSTPAKTVSAHFKFYEHVVHFNSSLITEFTDMQVTTELTSHSNHQNFIHLKWNLNLKPRDLMGSMLLNASGKVFDDDEKRTLKFGYSLKGREKHVELVVHNGDYSFQGKAEMNRRSKKLQVKIFTPTAGLEKLILNVNYNNAGYSRGYKKQVLVAKLVVNKEALELKGNEESDRSSNKVALAMTSSIRGFEQQEMQANYQILPGGKTVIDLSTVGGSLKIDGALTIEEMSAKATLTINDKTSSLISIDSQYQISDSIVKANVDLRIHDDQTQLLFTFVPKSNLYEMKIQLLTPYEGFEDMGIAVDCYRQLDSDGIELRGSITVWPNPNTPVKLTGSMNWSHSAIKAEIVYVNPFQNLDTKIETIFDWGQTTVSATCVNNKTKRFELKFKTEVDQDESAVEMSIFPTIYSFQGFKAKKIHKVSTRDNRPTSFTTGLEIELLTDTEETNILFSGSFGVENTTEDVFQAFSKLKLQRREMKCDFLFTNMFFGKTGQNHGTIQLNVPKGKFQSIKFFWKLLHTNENLDIALRGEINDQLIGLKITNVQQPDHVDAQIELMTPFEMLKSVRVVFTVDFRSPQQKTAALRFHLNEHTLGGGFKFQTATISEPILTADVGWGQGQEIQVKLVQTVSQGITSFQLLLKTEVRNCEHNSFKVSYKLSDISDLMVSVSGHVCEGIGYKKWKLQGNVQSEQPKSKIIINLTVGEETFASAITSYEKSEHTYSFNSRLQWRDKVSNIQGAINDDDNVRSGYFTITTPYEGYRLTNVRFMYSKNPKHKTASFTIEPPTSRKFQFDIEGEFTDANDFNFNSTLRLPIRGFEAITVNARHQIKDKLSGFLKCGWKRNKNININWDINRKQGVVAIDTPFESLSSLKVSGAASMKKEVVSIKSEAEWKIKRTTQKTGFNFELTQKLPKNLILTAHLYTPFREFQDLQLYVKHSYNKKHISTHFTAVVPYLIPRTAGTFEWTEDRDVKAFAITFAQRERKIEASGHIQISLPRMLNADVTFDSNMFTVPIKNLAIEYSSIPDGKIRAMLKADTPYSSYRYVVEYENDGQKVNVQADFDWPSRRSRPDHFQLKGTVINVNGVGSGSFRMMLPNSEHKIDTTFTVLKNTAKGTFMISSDLVKGREFQGDFNVNVQSNEIQALLRFATPFQTIENIEFNYRVNDDDIDTEFVVKTVTDEYKQSFTCNRNQRKDQGAVHLEIPWRHSGKLSMDGTLVRENGKFSMQLTFATPTARHQLSGQFWMTETTINVNLNLNSPVVRSPLGLQFRVTFDNRRNHWKKLAVDLGLKQQDQSRNFSVTYTNDPEMLYFDLTFKSIYGGWKSYMKLGKEDNQLKILVELTTTGEKHFIDATFRPMRRGITGFTGDIVIQSPLLHQPPIEILVEMEFADPVLFDAILKVVADGQTHLITGHVFKNQTCLTTEFTTESTLFKGDNKITSTATLEWKTPEKRELYAHLSMYNEDYKLLAQSLSSSADRTIRMKIETPLPGFTEFDVNVRVDKSNGCKMNLDLYLKNFHKGRSFQATYERTVDTLFLQALLDLNFIEPIGISLGGHYNNAAGNGQVTATYGNNEYRGEFNFLNVERNHGDASLTISFPKANEKQSIKLIMNYNYTPENGLVTSKTELITSFKNYNLFSVEAMYQPGWRNKTFTINIQTPFHNFETIVISTRTTVDVKTHVHHYRCRVSLPASSYEFTEEIMENGNDISISFGWKVDEKLTTIKGTIKTFPERKLELTLTGPEKEIFSGHVTWQDFRNTTLDIEGRYYEHAFGFAMMKTQDSIQLRLTTPFAGYEMTSAKVAWRHTDEEKEITVILNILKNEYHAKMITGNQAYSLELKTPLNKLEDIKIDLSYKNDIMLDIVDKGVRIIHLQIPTAILKGRFEVIVFNRSMHATIEKEILNYNASRYSIVGEICTEMSHCRIPTVSYQYLHYSTETSVDKSMVVRANEKTVTWYYSASEGSTGFQSKSKLQWSRNNILSYDFMFAQNTSPKKNLLDEKNATLLLNLFSREYELHAYYKHDTQNLNTAAHTLFNWHDSQGKTQESGFKYSNEKTSPIQTMKLSFVHPALQKDILVQVVTRFEQWQLSEANLLLDYSPNTQDQLKVELKKTATPIIGGVKWELRLIHSPSILNTVISLEFVNNQQELQGTLEFHHIDRTEQRQSYIAELKILKQLNKIELMVQMNENNLGLFGVVNEAGLLLSQTWNSQHPDTIIRVVFFDQNPQLLATIMYDKAHLQEVTVRAGLASPSKFEFEVAHNNQTHINKEISISFSLQNGNLLKNQFFWNPEFPFTVVDKFVHRYRLVKQQYDISLQEIGWELESKNSMLMNEIRNTIVPVKKDVLQQYEDLKKAASDTWKEMDETWKDIEIYSKYVRVILEHSSEWLKSAWINTNILSKHLPKITETTWKMISKFHSYVGHKFDDFLECMHTKLRTYAQDTVQVLHDIQCKLLKMAVRILLTFNDNFVQPAMNRWVYPNLNHMWKKTTELISNIYLVAMDVLVDPNVIGSTHQILRTCYNTSVRQTKLAYERTVTYVTQTMNHPYIKHSIYFITGTYNIMERFVMREEVSTLIRELCSSIQTETYNAAYDLIVAYPKLTIDLSHKFVYRPDEGFVEYYQHLPVSWSSFKELPNFSEAFDLKHLVQWRDHVFDHIQKLTTDIYEKFRS